MKHSNPCAQILTKYLTKIYFPCYNNYVRDGNPQITTLIKIKGDITMETRFELNEMTYTANANRTYCYCTANGTKTRIKRDEFEKAEVLYKETTANEEPKMVEITDEEAFEEALERAEEDIITEEGQEVVREMKKEKKAKRAKKNIAFSVTHDGIEISLTEKQVDFINHLPDTNFWEHGLNSCIWVDCLCDEIGGQFADKPMTVGAMISTLCEKGLGVRAKERINGRKCTSFELTELGKKVAKELGLN